jgi:leucyl aminopeptidase (aminopeptidase T)
MNQEEKIKMFRDVFNPKSGEHILFLVDLPHNALTDTPTWRDRRTMANEWFQTFKEMGKTTRFSVDWMEYKATGKHNAPIPREMTDAVRHANLVIAMTEFSATTSLAPICMATGSTVRGASMPMVERRMENTAFTANYAEVQRYARSLQHMLDTANGAEILFSTGDTLYLDLRNRVAEADTGQCSQPGQFINFPSGESCKTPYEGTPDEVGQFGPSQTKGALPMSYAGEMVKYAIEQNRIVRVVGKGHRAGEMRRFFAENDTRRNIAELGMGCNPKAVITGNVLEDEKVGLHIAYGTSTHLRGKVTSDMHEDICYSKGCPVEGTTVVLINPDGSRTELVRNAMLRYDLLK